MDRLLKDIDKQILFNQDKNMFFDDLGIFQFSSETIMSIQKIDHLDSDSKQYLVDYTTDKVIEEFCRVNQYYTLDSQAKQSLKKIYSELFDSFRNSKNPVDEISRIHYEKLKAWLTNYNPFAEKICKSNIDRIAPVACSEYCQELQIDILNIDIVNLMEPVLDIGCGKTGYFVKHLVEKGIDVIGIDRFSFSTPRIYTADWLEYDYGVDKWGTVVSNLGFSNHFIHHNQREDGNYINYAKTYMNILQSLNIGGSFHYAPDLPFIERYLDNSRFSINKKDIRNSDFRTTIVTRLK